MAVLMVNRLKTPTRFYSPVGIFFYEYDIFPFLSQVIVRLYVLPLE